MTMLNVARLVLYLKQQSGGNFVSICDEQHEKEASIVADCLLASCVWHYLLVSHKLSELILLKLQTNSRTLCLPLLLHCSTVQLLQLAQAQATVVHALPAGYTCRSSRTTADWLIASLQPGQQTMKARIPSQHTVCVFSMYQVQHDLINHKRVPWRSVLVHTSSA